MFRLKSGFVTQFAFFTFRIAVLRFLAASKEKSSSFLLTVSQNQQLLLWPRQSFTSSNKQNEKNWSRDLDRTQILPCDDNRVRQFFSVDNKLSWLLREIFTKYPQQTQSRQSGVSR